MFFIIIIYLLLLIIIYHYYLFFLLLSLFIYIYIYIYGHRIGMDWSCLPLSGWIFRAVGSHWFCIAKDLRTFERLLHHSLPKDRWIQMGHLDQRTSQGSSGCFWHLFLIEPLTRTNLWNWDFHHRLRVSILIHTVYIYNYIYV